MFAHRSAVLLLTLCSGCASGPDRPATTTARPAPDRAVAVVFLPMGLADWGKPRTPSRR